jgi:phospholipase/carboxylesterase
MNRLALVSDSTFSALSKSNIGHTSQLETSPRHRFARGFDLPYATFAPMHYEERYAYPLIVWLHGSDSNEQELRQVMPLVSMRNYVAIAPRGTSESSRARNRFDWRESAEAIESTHARIVDCVAVAQDRFNIHPNRIFLVGRGTGGTMALRTAWSDPDRFAGIAAINGPLPSHSSPMRRVNELRHVPCLLATSRNHQTYPADHVCQDLRLLHSAGCTVALRQYPGSDDLTSNMLSDLDRWLMELVCGAPAVAKHTS